MFCITVGIIWPQIGVTGDKLLSKYGAVRWWCSCGAMSVTVTQQLTGVEDTASDMI